MKRVLVLFALILPIAVTLVGCGGGSSSTPTPTSQSSSVFITGEDAPLPSVVGFNITLSTITLNGKNGTPQVLTAPTTVDFARLLGLRTLVGFNAVPADTYSSATIQLANPTIAYLNLSANPPTVANMNGTLTSSSVTVAFPKPMVVGNSGLAGLHMEFDLQQSLQVDGTGQITGVVNPVIDLQAVQPSDDGAQITELLGSLVSVNTGNNSFVLQRPDGHQVTIDVNSQTNFNATWSMSNLTTPAFVGVEGMMQGDGSILAAAVEVVSTDQAFLSGRIVAINPASGAAQTVTLLVGEEMPSMASIPLEQTITLNVSAVTDYEIGFFDNWFTGVLFNNSSMVPGQRIFVGGTFDSTSNTFTPQMISLRRQGVIGGLVTGSVNISSGNRGSFQLQNGALVGYVLGAPLTVQTGNVTQFIGVNGLLGLQAGGSMNLVARGFMLKDPVSGNPQLWAGRVRVLP
jgi:hypothetical protein